MPAVVVASTARFPPTIASAKASRSLLASRAGAGVAR